MIPVFKKKEANLTETHLFCSMSVFPTFLFSFTLMWKNLTDLFYVWKVIHYYVVVNVIL